MYRLSLVSLLVTSMLLPPTVSAAQESSQLAPSLITRFSDQCVVAPDIARGGLPEGAGLLATLAATLLPKAVGGLYNWVTGLITKAAEKKQVTKETNSGGYFYRVRAQADAANMRGCIQVFTLGPAGTTWESLATDPRIGRTVGEALKLGRYPGPDFFLEFAIDESSDRQYFRLIPTHLKMSRAFSGSKRETALVAAVTFSVPGSKEPFGSDAFKIGGIRPGSSPFAIVDLVGMDGKWSPKPAYSEALQARIARPKTAELTAQSFNPVNVAVAVTETQEANALLQSVASALAEGQKDVAAAVGAALPTEANQEAAEVAAIDEKNAYAEAAAAALVAIEEEKVAELSRMQAQTALDAAAAGEAKAKAEIALVTAEAALRTKQAATIKAKGAANKAAVKLRVAQPYPKIY